MTLRGGGGGGGTEALPKAKTMETSLTPHAEHRVEQVSLFTDLFVFAVVSFHLIFCGRIVC